LSAGAPAAVPLALVAAMARNRVIGRDNALPWHIPEDLRRFRTLTLGKPVLMGRRTFESIGRALPGRENWVLSRDPHYAAEGCRVFRSLAAALAAAGAREVMVIGGAELFRDTLPRARRMHLTLIDAEIPGDTLFPEFDPREWEIEHEQARPAVAGTAPGYRFVDYRRR